MTPIQVLSTSLLIFHCLVNFALASEDPDEFYKKFHQTDYKLKLGRELVTFCNRSVVDFNHSMYKYNRTQFVTNVTMLFHVDVGNDIEIIVQTFKFVSNEYRAFTPLRFEYNFCKGLKYDLAGIQSCIDACGYLQCPFKKDVPYYIGNCILNESLFPPFMPSGTFKLQLEAYYKNQVIGISELHLTTYRPVLLPGRKSG